MAEVRRYEAGDLRSARQKLAADEAELAQRGLRPTWMVWLDGVEARRTRGVEGELIVRFDTRHAGDSVQDLRVSLLLLVVKMRELVRTHEETLAQLDALEREPEPGPAGRRSRAATRLAFERRRTRIERLISEIERELDTLQQLDRTGRLRL